MRGPLYPVPGLTPRDPDADDVALQERTVARMLLAPVADRVLGLPLTPRLVEEIRHAVLASLRQQERDGVLREGYYVDVIADVFHDELSLRLVRDYARYPMDAAEFRDSFGREAVEDDLVRVNCPVAGAVMHSQCGVCPRHGRPRFECACAPTGGLAALPGRRHAPAIR